MKIRSNPIYKAALRLAVPMMIQNGITNAVGLVDNVMVGSIGSEAYICVTTKNGSPHSITDKYSLARLIVSTGSTSALSPPR